jgi:hypothetical protein
MTESGIIGRWSRRHSGIRLEGAKAIVQAFPGWLKLRHFARVLQPARAG